MQHSLFCLAAVLAFSVFGLERHHALVADEQAETRRATEVAALATAEQWAAVLRDAATDEAAPAAFGDYDGIDRVETARVALGFVLVRVRIDVRDADPATAGLTTALAATVTVTEVRTDGRAPVTLSVRAMPAGQDLHA